MVADKQRDSKGTYSREQLRISPARTHLDLAKLISTPAYGSVRKARGYFWATRSHGTPSVGGNLQGRGQGVHFSTIIIYIDIEKGQFEVEGCVEFGIKDGEVGGVL